MSEAKLRPCPFCGGEATLVGYGLPAIRTYYVECSQCKAPIDDAESEHEAIKKWNTRPIEDELIEACKWAARSFHHPECKTVKDGCDIGQCNCHVGACQAALQKAQKE
jgi:Lar family restriction alleviation protein